MDKNAVITLATEEAFLMGTQVFSVIAVLTWLTSGIFGYIDVKKSSVTTLAKVWTSLFLSLILLAQIAVGAAVAVNIDAQRSLMSTIFTSTTTRAERIEIEKTGRINVLLLGGDAGAGRWGLRPDSISVASIDTVSGAITLVGIPRNLQNFPFSEGSPMKALFPNGYDCGDSCLLNSVFTLASSDPTIYGETVDSPEEAGIQATLDAVEGITGLNIPFAALIDMSGFEEIVNSVGGVTVCVPGDVVVDSSLAFAAGCQLMDGTAALTYSRTRHDSNDYNRMQRQREVQDALLKQADPLIVLLNFQALASIGSEYVWTNIPRDLVDTLLTAATMAKDQALHSLERVLPTINVVYPDIEGIHDLVQAVISAD
jgi:LCP family protein required for cell wall assembly